MDALTALPGVGRKTANVVLGHALGVPGLAGRPARAAGGQSHWPGARRRPGEGGGAAVRDAAARNDGPALRRLDSPRPPDLQAQAAVPDLQRPQRLRLLHDRRRHEAGRSWRQVFGAPVPRTAKPRPSAARNQGAAESDECKTKARDDARALREPRSRMPSIASLAASRARSTTSPSSIEDEPSDELLDEMEIDDDGTLFGLYQGTPLTERTWLRQHAARSDHAVPGPDRRRLRRRRRRDRRGDRRDPDPRARPLLRHGRARDRAASKIDGCAAKTTRDTAGDLTPTAGGRVKARKRFGQHFLEPAWVAKLVKAVDAKADDSFLEIGPGRAAITRAACGAVRHGCWRWKSIATSRPNSKRPSPPT